MSDLKIWNALKCEMFIEITKEEVCVDTHSTLRSDGFYYNNNNETKNAVLSDLSCSFHV